MFKRTIAVSLVGASLFAAAALPAFAADATSTSTSTPSNEHRSAIGMCLWQAAKKDAQDLKAAIEARQTALKAARTKYHDAVDAANKLTDQNAKDAAIKAAREAFKKDREAANAQFRTAREAVKASFKSARATCKAQEADSDKK